MTDDISMGALSGWFHDRAAAAIRAGCDLVLHCNGELNEARDVAAGVPELAEDALRRTEQALSFLRSPEPVDRRALEARFDSLLAGLAAA
jgi:beta-N-acetylhexosaminidase